MRRDLFSVLLCLIFTGCASTQMVTQNQVGATCLPEHSYFLPLQLHKFLLDKCDSLDNIAITAADVPTVADRRQAYSLETRHSVWRDDNYTINTTEDGLLLKVISHSTHRGLDIAGQLAEVYSKVSAPALETTAKSGRDADLPPHFEMLFDVSDPISVKQLNGCLKPYGYEVNVACMAPQLQDEIEYRNVVTPVDGVVYRRALPYNVSVSKINPKCQVLKSILVKSTNRGPLSVIHLKSGLFTETKQELTFENGSLTGSTESRPSEPYALAAGILKIASTIVEVPLKQIQSDTALANAEKARADAQKSLAEAELLKIEAQRKLRQSTKEEAAEETGTELRYPAAPAPYAAPAFGPALTSLVGTGMPQRAPSGTPECATPVPCKDSK